jgi:hypothetical protein
MPANRLSSHFAVIYHHVISNPYDLNRPCALYRLRLLQLVLVSQIAWPHDLTAFIW